MRTELPDNQRCTATRDTNTPSGPGQVRCRKPAGHVDAGDPRHDGGNLTYWTDAQLSGH